MNTPALQAGPQNTWSSPLYHPPITYVPSEGLFINHQLGCTPS